MRSSLKENIYWVFGGLGLLVAVVLCLAIPRQYEVSGEFRVAYINHQQFIEFPEVGTFLSGIADRIPGVSVKFFRLEQFKYIVKFRSTSPERLAQVEHEFRQIIDHDFRKKYDSVVASHQAELTEVSEQLAEIQAAIKQLSQTPSKTPSEKLTLFQFRKLMVELVERRNLLNIQLNEDSTKYFAYTPYKSSALKVVFPQWIPFLFFSITAGLLFAFVIQRFVLFRGLPLRHAT